MYVPRDASEIVFADAATAAQQWERLNAFIENDDYLSERRGQYAERNQSRTPFENIFDLRILQDFYLEMGNGKRNTLQLSLDIFNVGNLLNQDWGRRYNRQFSGYELLQFVDFAADGTTPTFEYEGFDEGFDDDEAWNGDLDDAGFLSSRWQMQFGVRYIFGN